MRKSFGATKRQLSLIREYFFYRLMISFLYKSFLLPFGNCTSTQQKGEITERCDPIMWKRDDSAIEYTDRC